MERVCSHCGDKFATAHNHIRHEKKIHKGETLSNRKQLTSWEQIPSSPAVTRSSGVRKNTSTSPLFTVNEDKSTYHQEVSSLSHKRKRRAKGDEPNDSLNDSEDDSTSLATPPVEALEPLQPKQRSYKSSDVYVSISLADCCGGEKKLENVCL